MSRKMGSLEIILFILLFSMINQILSDHPVTSTIADESYVPTEFRMKRSHALKNNFEKRDEAIRANKLAAIKLQITPKARPMNLRMGEPVAGRRAAVPVIQNKATATVIQPKNITTATIVQPKDVSGAIIHPQVTNTATIDQQKPVATATVIQPVIEPQINPKVSIVQSKCVPTASIIQPNLVSVDSTSDIQPRTTTTSSIIKSKINTVCEKPIITELPNCTIIHQTNSTTSETVFHDIHGNSNDSLKTEHHYIVDIPFDRNSNNTNTIHDVIVNHTHSVNDNNLSAHENTEFYEENTNGANIVHSVLQDTSHSTREAKPATFPASYRKIKEIILQNSTDSHKVCAKKDKLEVFEMSTLKPNVKEEITKTLPDLLKQVNIDLLNTPKPLISGNIGDIKVVENKMEEHNLDQIKLEPDEDIVIDKFDVEEVKESYKNPTDYANDVSTVLSDWCIYPTVNNQGIQSSNGAIISNDDYVNYYNTGGYEDNSKGVYSYDNKDNSKGLYSYDNKDNSRGVYSYDNKDNSKEVYSYDNYKGNSKAANSYPYIKYYCVTQAPKAKKLSNAERNLTKDRIWRKWINTQIYIRRPTYDKTSPKVKEHVNSALWSQEQKIPVIGYNGYYTNQNNSYFS